jgi:hypothetical protein
VAKSKKPRRGWTKEIKRAARASAANKKRLDTASSSGLASDKTLADRGYDSDPTGGGPRVPRPASAPEPGKGEKQKQRR